MNHKNKYTEIECMDKEFIFARYMLFSFCAYSEQGGLQDVENSFNSIDDAQKAYEECRSDYVTIFDRVEGKIISKKSNYE